MAVLGRVDIGIGSKAVVAMPQPGLDVLHGIAKVEHNRRAAMSQIMKTNGAKAVQLQNLLKFLTDKIRLQEHSHGIHADKIVVFVNVGASAELHLVQLAASEKFESYTYRDTGAESGGWILSWWYHHEPY